MFGPEAGWNDTRRVEAIWTLIWAAGSNPINSLSLAFCRYDT